MVKVAILERRDYKAEIVSFLMMYRNTPHTMTNVAPAKLLLTYQPRTKLPQWESNRQSKAMRQAREHDKKMKDHMKSYYNKKHKVKESDIKVGDTIIQQQEKKQKFTTRFDPRPYKVMSRSRNALTIERDGVRYRRNVSKVKKVRGEFGVANTNDNQTFSEALDEDGIEADNDDVEVVRGQGNEVVEGEVNNEELGEEGIVEEDREQERDGQQGIRPARERNKHAWHDQYEFK